MRAIYYPEMDFDQTSFNISGDQAHHLLNVVRVKRGEEVLLLNGSGMAIQASADLLEKKSLTLTVLKRDFFQRPPVSIHLLLSTPKKEYLEESLRLATEIGVTKISLIQSAYSQLKNIDTNRALKIMENALIQSNNPYMPSIDFTLKPINSIFTLIDQGSQVLLFTSLDGAHDEYEVVREKIALIIGPEGGFSSEEETFLTGDKNVIKVKLPLPILKTVTAVPVAIGHLHGRIKRKSSVE